MNPIKSVCIFCGSKLGKNPIYAEQAKKFVDVLCQNNITIVYGGSNVGLMKVVADRALENGGHIIGVMPEKLVDIEQAHQGLKDLRIVKDMAERKALMAELSDAFVMLPGGLGSFDEFFEMMILTQLGYQHQPSAILNVNNYFDKLVDFLNHVNDEGFLLSEYFEKMIISDTSKGLLEVLVT